MRIALCLLVMCSVAYADVVIKRVGVEVAPTDASGKPWDKDSSGPDPQIRITIDGGKVQRCNVARDTFRADCEVAKREPSARPLEIELSVADVDVIHDEAIGKARGTIASDAAGRVELAVDNQLVHAWADVEQVGARWVSTRVASLLAALIGVALALMPLAIWRGRYLTPPNAKPASGLAPAPATTDPRFWRSPILLAGASSALAGAIVANYVYGSTVQPLIAAIPMALGVFAIASATVDAFGHERMGGTRTRVMFAGIAASVAVPVFGKLGGLGGVAAVIVGLGVAALLLWSLLESI
jgi:hypothetical protein